MRPFRARLGLASLLLLAAAARIDDLWPAAQAAGPVSSPVLKWQRGGCFASWCQTGWYASPAVADLDGDGQPEVIWGSYDLVVLRGSDGSLRARAPSTSRVWPGVVAADLDGDGTPEIVVGRNADEVTVYRASVAGPTMTLNTVWTRNPFGSGEVRTLAVEDLEHDGQLEVIVGRGSGGATKQMSVYEPNGTVRPGWPARHDAEAGYGWGMYNENVTVADLGGDGFKEIVGPTDTHYITALDRGGSQLPASAAYGSRKVWSQVGVHVLQEIDLQGYADCGLVPPAPLARRLRPNFANMAPAIADLDGDGVPEIVAPGNTYDCDAGNDADGDLYVMPWILKRDRTRWSAGSFDWTILPSPEAGSAPLSEDYNIIENNVTNPAIADLDGDGQPEILYPAYDGKLHAYWLDKTEHGNWPFVVPGTGIRFAGEPVVADLNNDGQAEVIFTSWGEKGSATRGQVHVLDSMGNQLYAVDLPASFPAGGWNGGLAAPTIANIDGDPDYELVVGTSASGVVAYDLPGSANARILWGTGRGGYHRTGVPDLIFKDGFESGNLATWSASATNGGSLGVSGAAGMAFTSSGLQATVSDTSGIYVQDDSPRNEGRYRARFYFDPNGFDTGEASGHARVRVFIAFGDTGQRLVTIVLRRLSGVYSLEGRTRLDDGTRADTPFVGITNGPHMIELDWKRSSGPSANNGWFQMWIDGSSVAALTGLDNSASGVEFARMGAMSVKTGASGVLHWDQFESHRQGAIGRE